MAIEATKKAGRRRSQRQPLHPWIEKIFEVIWRGLVLFNALLLECVAGVWHHFGWIKAALIIFVIGWIAWGIGGIIISTSGVLYTIAAIFQLAWGAVIDIFKAVSDIVGVSFFLLIMG